MPPDYDANNLLITNTIGFLSTHSSEMPGYPFTSVVPYSLDDQQCPVILISNIAQHYHNIRMLPKVSLLVLASDCDDVQAAKRLTWIADAQPVAQDDHVTIDQYYRRFPLSRDYHNTLGFHFFRLLPVRICYIAGFGKIHWYEANQWMDGV